MTMKTVCNLMLKGAVPKIGEALVVGCFALAGKLAHDSIGDWFKNKDEEKKPCNMYDLKEES